MTKIRFLLVASSAFVAGIAFILACGNGTDGMIDASLDAHAADCKMCEPPITSDRIYEVVAEATSAGTPVEATATCAQGDVLLGGGCWVLAPDDTDPLELAGQNRPILASGPIPAVGGGSRGVNVYDCIYQNGDGTETIKVIATAKCFKPAPAQ